MTITYIMNIMHLQWSTPAKGWLLTYCHHFLLEIFPLSYNLRDVRIDKILVSFILFSYCSGKSRFDGLVVIIKSIFMLYWDSGSEKRNETSRCRDMSKMYTNFSNFFLTTYFYSFRKFKYVLRPHATDVWFWENEIQMLKCSWLFLPCFYVQRF